MTAEQYTALSAACCIVTAICNLLVGIELRGLRKSLHSAISRIYAAAPKLPKRKP